MEPCAPIACPRIAKCAFTVAAILLVELVAASPSGTTEPYIAPSAAPLPGCSYNYYGAFELAPTNLSSSSSHKRALRSRAAVTITLKNGVLSDSDGATGYIADNEQFQFNDPVPTSATWTGGFSVCGNGSLALGHTAIWRSCLSDNYYNIYYKNSADNCFDVIINTVGVEGGHPHSASVSTTKSSTSSASPSSTSTTSPGTTTNASTNKRPSSGAGLGSAELGGIVTGAVVGACIIVLILWLFWRKRKRSRVPRSSLQEKDQSLRANNVDDMTQTHEVTSDGVHELHGEHVEHQLMSRERYELGHESRTQELGAGQQDPSQAD